MPARSPPPSTGLTRVLAGHRETPTTCVEVGDDLVREHALLGDEVALPVHEAAGRLVEERVAAVPKLLLAIGRPPLDLPRRAGLVHLVERLATVMSLNGISWLTHWL